MISLEVKSLLLIYSDVSLYDWALFFVRIARTKRSEKKSFTFHFDFGGAKLSAGGVNALN